ncbi:MAG: RNA polymerase sigma-70 factor [Bacteroidota bacterium]
MPISISDFEELFKSNHKSLCRIANHIVNDRAGAEDIVQDVFLKVWNLRDTITTESLVGYLYRATTNGSLNYIESGKRFNRITNEIIPSTYVDPSTAITQKELESHIQKALDALPPKCKVIFVLSRFEGMRYKQIAGHLEISVKTVENQMGKALGMMREELKPFLTREFLILVITAGVSVLLRFFPLIMLWLALSLVFN